MSVEFAQKNELARIANLEEEKSMVQRETQWVNNINTVESFEELESHRNEKIATKYEELKSLSREISEECGETSSVEGQFQPDAKPAEIPKPHGFNLRLLKDTSSDKEHMQKRSLASIVKYVLSFAISSHFEQNKLHENSPLIFFFLPSHN